MTPFEKRVLETERKKLRAVQDKLPQAIKDRNLGRVADLAQAAERIASRLIILIDNMGKHA